jgi:hypothetical protein
VGWSARGTGHPLTRTRISDCPRVLNERCLAALMSMLREVGEVVNVDGVGTHAFVYSEFPLPAPDNDKRWYDSPPTKLDTHAIGAGVLSLMDSILSERHLHFKLQWL